MQLGRGGRYRVMDVEAHRRGIMERQEAMEADAQRTTDHPSVS